MENYSDWKTIPIPAYMKDLKMDSRGYPIPYIIFCDTNGVYHFKINDHKKTMECLDTRICAICGRGLGKDMWLAGGPLAAFHPDGAYIDTPMHHECGQYALQVCPYLATRFYKEIEIDLSKVAAKDNVFIDPTMIPGRPDLFVFIKISDFKTIPGKLPGQKYVIPSRPYLETEFWNKGQRLSEMQAEVILTKGRSLLGG